MQFQVNKANLVYGQLEKLSQNAFQMTANLEKTPVVQFSQLSVTLAKTIAQTETLEKQVTESAALTGKQVKILTELVKKIRGDFIAMKTCVDSKTTPKMTQVGNYSHSILAATKVSIAQSITDHTALSRALEDYSISFKTKILQFTRDVALVTTMELKGFVDQLKRNATKLKMLKTVAELSPNLTFDQQTHLAREFGNHSLNIKDILRKVTDVKDVIENETPIIKEILTEMERETSSDAFAMIKDTCEVLIMAEEVKSISDYLISDLPTATMKETAYEEIVPIPLDQLPTREQASGGTPAPAASGNCLIS